MSICASLGSAATGTGRGGLARRGFQGKMIDDASSCHIKETVSSLWRPAKNAGVDIDTVSVKKAVKRFQSTV